MKAPDMSKRDLARQIIGLKQIISVIVSELHNGELNIDTNTMNKTVRSLQKLDMKVTEKDGLKIKTYIKIEGRPENVVTS
jgi:hypothetical protein